MTFVETHCTPALKVAPIMEILNLRTDWLPAAFSIRPSSQQAGTKAEEAPALVQRNAAPDATQPLVPLSPTLNVTITSACPVNPRS